MVDSIAFSGQNFNRQGRRGRPRLTSLNYTLGDTDGGGQSIVASGEWLKNPTVTVGGNIATILTSSLTQATFALPAHASGLVDVVIATRDGTIQLANGFEYWSPVDDINMFDYLDSGKNVVEAAGTGALSTCDTYSSANQSTARTMRGGAEQTSMVGQAFTGNGQFVSTATFFLKKTGTPTGNMFAYIYSHTGAFGDGSTSAADQVLATSAVIDAGTLTTSYVNTTFTFSGVEQIKLEAGVYYVVVVQSGNGDASNNVQVGSDSTGEHNGSSCFFVGAFARSPDDVCFTVETRAGSGKARLWTDVAYGDTFVQPTSANQPTIVANGFGTISSLRFATTQWVTGSLQNMSATGHSVFAVAKWTSTDTVTNGHAGNVPLTIVGDRVNASGSFGASGGQVSSNHYVGSTVVVNRGSGLNDGVARLIGATYNTIVNTKIYVGDVQQGATDTSAALASPDSWNTVGAGYAGLDGWNGDLGAVLVFDGEPAALTITRLNRWARQRFGTP